VAPATTAVGASAPAAARPGAPGASARSRAGAALRLVPAELVLLAALAALLNLWALSRNGWANEYYSAAVRSMSSSWHNFLFASADPSGVMTVDKPPLALWVQALSARAFGYHPLSLLVPQALMGIASVALTYDLVRRRFGRLGGFVAGLALAVTPMTVAVSRHNNPDALLVLCCVAAVWFAVRALENGSTRRLVLAGVCVGLGFETKMGVALAVVPGIAAAWLWLAPAARGRLHALRQLLAGAVAMLAVGGAWPALMALTPAADRPWASGTSDNSIFSLIFGYNGLGRVDGQTGGPGGGPGGAGGFFGGATGPFRLLNASLGGQAGWLLGFALASALALLLATRLRRSDARSGWLIAVGGAFAATAVLFSFATGIFHPYYVALLAPFAAALTGAGVAELRRSSRRARILAPAAIAAGVAVELVVRTRYPGQLEWLPPLLIGAGGCSALALAALASPRARMAALSVAAAALLAAPSVWAVDTLGHSASGTFPAGGPASAQAAGGGPPGGFLLRSRAGRLGGALGQLGPGQSSGALPPGPAAGASGGPSGLAGGPPPAGFAGSGASPGAGPGAGAPPAGTSPGFGFGFGGPGGAGRGAAPFGSQASITRALAYVKSHGGGTLAVASQSSASSAIVAQHANVAGIGGFSGRESSVGVSWLAQRVRSGAIRWVLAEQVGAGPRLPGDTRTGSQAAISAVAKACRAVSLPTRASSATEGAAGLTPSTSGEGTLYDCRGRSQQLLSAGG
jgi:4-amino-4-deoxy-L-arabinose transferase-like glycosyltransferase